MQPDRHSSAADRCRALKDAESTELPALLAEYAADSRDSVRAAVQRAYRRLGREAAEDERLARLYEFESVMQLERGGLVVGVDEVGRGAIAGPVTAAAVVLPSTPRIPRLTDSKRLSPSRRNEVADAIRSVSLGIGIAHVPPDRIDDSGIVRATLSAMRDALAGITVDWAWVLVDGRDDPLGSRCTPVVKGDATVACIAAASIVAKTERDRLMTNLSNEFPGYDLAANKGYGTSDHFDCIDRLGHTPIHRVTFLRDTDSRATLF